MCSISFKYFKNFEMIHYILRKIIIILSTNFVSFSAITHADNGVYTCSLIGEKDGREEVMSKKTVKVIVLSKYCK